MGIVRTAIIGTRVVPVYNNNGPAVVAMNFFNHSGRWRRRSRHRGRCLSDRGCRLLATCEQQSGRCQGGCGE